MNLVNNIHVAGEYDVYTRKVVRNRKGRITYRGALRHRASGRNLITDTGMDILGSSNLDAFSAFLQVGTSNTAPVYGNTSLGARVAGVAMSSMSFAWEGSTFVITRTATFGVGAAAGVLAELGLAAAAASNTLRTHSLFRDGGGSPITITVLADEQLIVTYRLLFTVGTADSTLVKTQKGTEYTLTLRPARVGMTQGFAGQWSGGARLSWLTTHNTGFAVDRGTRYHGATSAIGAVNSVPTGTAVTLTTNQWNLSYGTYTNGNHYRDDVLSLPLTEGNGADTGAWVIFGMPFSVQIGISPRVSKTGSDLMSFTARTTWTRD